jgi:hypothetical protein
MKIKLFTAFEQFPIRGETALSGERRRFDRKVKEKEFKLISQL